MLYINAPDTDGDFSAQTVTSHEEYRDHGISPSVVYFAPDATSQSVGFAPDDTTVVFSDYASFKAARVVPTCFVIGTDNAEKAKALLCEIRADSDTMLLPVFLVQPFGQEIDELSDGIVRSIAEAADRASSINVALRTIEQDVSDDQENALYHLLGYLHTRPEVNIEPHREWQIKQYYAYPLAQSFLDDNIDAALWLQGLVNRKLIEPAALIDRIRICPSCESAHLNYVDICPNCSGIHIQQKPFLHCFACGHVGPEEAFLSKGYLSCPNCMARLRHIGSDYDRPMENYECDDCHHKFIEPEISARCMHCSAVNSPEELVARNIYSFRITDRGRTTAKTGNLEDVYAVLDTINNVGLFHFESFLDWFLRLCARHKEEHFSLVGIQMVNIEELSEILGRFKVSQLVDEFVRRIRDLVRSTDITTRTSQRNLWLLLPKTNEQNCEIVLGRIRDLLSQTEQTDGSRLEIDTVSFSAPDDALAGETAKLLMGRLEGALQS